jgi:HPt (histidine-containing phosphotransfer) domain-containing protein
LKTYEDKSFSLRRLCEGVLQGLYYAGLTERGKISYAIHPLLEGLICGPSIELTNLLNLLFTWVLTENSIASAAVEWNSSQSDNGIRHLTARVCIFPASGHGREICPDGFISFPSAQGIVDKLSGTMAVREGCFLDITIPLADSAPAIKSPIEMEKMLEDFPDPALCRCLIEDFFLQTENLLESLSAGLSSGDFAAVHRIAHTIKGGALNIHAPGLSRTAKEFENDAKSLRLENGTYYLEKLRRELSAAVEYFRILSKKDEFR